MNKKIISILKDICFFTLCLFYLGLLYFCYNYIHFTTSLTNFLFAIILFFSVIGFIFILIKIRGE